MCWVAAIQYQMGRPWILYLGIYVPCAHKYSDAHALFTADGRQFISSELTVPHISSPAAHDMPYNYLPCWQPKVNKRWKE